MRYIIDKKSSGGYIAYCDQSPGIEGLGSTPASALQRLLIKQIEEKLEEVQEYPEIKVVMER